ncbi:MAG: GldG family protein [Polyangiaceae bacterium]|nr:GldG family protein [Polyangiaceae bacterium]
MAMERKKKASAESSMLLLVVAAILIAVNALSYFMYYRKDTTKAERYTLSEGSARLLRSMKGNMKVDAYVTKGLPKLDAFVRDLRDLLQQYKDASKGKFDYTIIEAKDEEQKKKAKEAGLQEVQFGEGSDTEDKAEFAKGYMGLVLNYGAERETIPVLSPDNNVGLEFWITNKIREVRDKGDGIKHKIGLLTGNDEIKLSAPDLLPANTGQKPTLQGLITRYWPFYQIVDVDLKNGEADVDESLDGIIITQPGKDISEKELRRIDAFVMKGKSLAVVASAVNVKPSDASMTGTLSTRGLEKLLEGYGIEMRKDALLEFGRPFRVPMQSYGGLQIMRFPPVLDVHDDFRFTGDEQLLDTSFAPFFRVPQIGFPFASSLVLHREKQPDVAPDKFKVVARTTPKTMQETGDTVDLRPLRQWRPKGAFNQFPIAVSIEGKLKSAFAGSDKMGVEAPTESTNTARVLVISSSQFFANPFARAGNGPEMGGQMGMMMQGMGGDETLQAIAGSYAQQIVTNVILVTKNTLDWVTGDVDLLAASAKILQEPSLAYGDVSKPNFDDMTEEQLKRADDTMKKERKKTQYWVESTLIVGLPVLFGLLGVVLWRRRISARENYQLA